MTKVILNTTMATPEEVIIIDSSNKSVMSELEIIIHWNKNKE